MTIVPPSEISQNKSLHETDINFGNRHDAAGFAKRLPLALLRLAPMGVCQSVLDYGTGKGKLVERLRAELPDSFTIDGYDPAVSLWADKPSKTKYDLVCSFDVLEHIEPKSIESVVSDICLYTGRFSYVVIDLQPAVKRISDGRNAHILLAPSDWWTSLFSRHFSVNISFIIPHMKGHPQKLVIVSSNDPKYLPIMNLFVNKLEILNLLMDGGTLGISKQSN